MARKWPLALGLLLGLAAVYAGMAAGHDRTEDWQLAARWTARVGFPVLITAYAASSLLRLWPSALTKALVRDRRWWGLGFAASHTVHLYALVTYLRIKGEPPDLPTLIGGGGAYVILYLMALTSSDSAQRTLGRNWKRLHTVGIHWLWFIFAFSYLGRVAEGADLPYSAVALAVALAALGLRIAAWAKARAQRLAT